MNTQVQHINTHTCVALARHNHAYTIPNCMISGAVLHTILAYYCACVSMCAIAHLGCSHRLALLFLVGHIMQKRQQCLLALFDCVCARTWLVCADWLFVGCSTAAKGKLGNARSVAVWLRVLQVADTHVLQSS